jgi:hypothetical protein
MAKMPVAKMNTAGLSGQFLCPTPETPSKHGNAAKQNR